MSVRVDTHDGVTEIVLDRPDQRNALIPSMLDGVCDALEDVGKAAIIRGEGPVFCAGFDLERCVKDEGALLALLTGLDKAITAIRRCDAPVVVGVHGAAIAGGCALLAGADVVVADRGAKLGYPVTRLGISPGVSAPTLALAIGHGQARSRLLDPALFDGADAHRIGLVHELVDHRDDVLRRARQVAGELAGKPQAGLRATKRWLMEIEASLTRDDGEALETSVGLVGQNEQRRLLREAWVKRRKR